MDVDEDDGYSDDDLDALPADAFHKLQEDAFISTQQAARADQASFVPVSRPQNRGPSALNGRLERLSVVGKLPSFDTPVNQDFPHQPSSDYGDLDDEMLDGEIYDAAEEPGVNAIQASRAAALPFGESTQRELWRQQRHGMPPQPINSDFPGAPLKPQTSNNANGFHVKPREVEETLSFHDDVHRSRQPDIEALHAQINEVRGRCSHISAMQSDSDIRKAAS